MKITLSALITCLLSISFHASAQIDSVSTNNNELKLLPSNQARANELYQGLGNFLIDTLALEPLALQALPLQLTAAETRQRMSILRQLKSIASVMDELAKTPAYEYLSGLAEFSSRAGDVRCKILDLQLKRSYESCNQRRIALLKNLEDENYLYQISIHDLENDIRMTTTEAMRLLKHIREDLKQSFVGYIEQGASKEEKIRRGRELHVALKVMRSALHNHIWVPSASSSVTQLLKGCEEGAP